MPPIDPTVDQFLDEEVANEEAEVDITTVEDTELAHKEAEILEDPPADSEKTTSEQPPHPPHQLKVIRKILVSTSHQSVSTTLITYFIMLESLMQTNKAKQLANDKHFDMPQLSPSH